MLFSRSIVTAAVLSLVSLLADRGAAQPPAEAYVPPSAMAALTIRPQVLFNHPDVLQSPLRMFPVEVAEAWGEENFGISPLAIAEIKALVGMPLGPGPPPVGMVVTLLEDFDPSNIAAEMLAGEPGEVDGWTRYPLATGNPMVELVLVPVDSRVVLVADPLMLEGMRGAEQGVGPLAELLAANPIGAADVQLAVPLQPLRPFVGPAVESLPPDMPDEIADLVRSAVLIHAAVLRVKFTGSDLAVRLEVIGDDEQAAERLLAASRRALQFGKAATLAELAEMAAEMEPGKVADAMNRYAQRLADEMFDAYKPSRRDQRVVLDYRSDVTLATSGILVGLLLPAVQASRAAARRMSSSNNLKQVGLAMHNFHDTYNELPLAAIHDDDGQPLLSWRVAILPFIEQPALFERFRLDEPWDSPHNIELLAEMPATYASPGIELQPGNTVIHAMIGEGMALSEDEAIRFQNFLDGLSNTILAIEGNSISQVPWTKPEALQIDPDDPLAHFHLAYPEGFNVLFADGAVRFFSNDIDTEIFGAMLTRDGGEAVSMP